MSRLICWQPVLTDHQRHTLDALGIELGTAPEYIVTSRTLAERDRQGWTAAAVPQTVLPRRGVRAWVADRLRAAPDAVHIFGSPFGDRRLIAVLRQVLAADARVWLVSEPWADTAESYFADRPGWRDRAKAVLRPLLYRLYGRMIRNVAGVFAISPLAVRQYAAIGVPRARIVPFGYFVPGPANLPAPSPHAGLRVVFVGALIARKGISDLAAAARILVARGSAVTIDVFGPGSLPPGCSGLIHRGTIAFGAAAATMAHYDVLVVPSRYDGWAVVVNEALMAGVPVVASDRTGAGAMIDRWGCGRRFPAGIPAALADELERLATDPSILPPMRAAARALSPALVPSRAARYMAAALRGGPEANPWF